MRIALDTNVIVSAQATRGLCADLFQAVLAEHDLVVSETVLSELRRVLTRKLRLPSATIDAVEAFVRRQAVVTTAAASRTSGELDAADMAVVEGVLAGGVDVLVTGDQELLKAPNLPVKTVSPRQLWDLIRRAR